jgi:hypothetical protein
LRVAKANGPDCLENRAGVGATSGNDAENAQCLKAVGLVFEEARSADIGASLPPDES